MHHQPQRSMTARLSGGRLLLACLRACLPAGPSAAAAATTGVTHILLVLEAGQELLCIGYKLLHVLQTAHQAAAKQP
jgi:hypothetical protein